MSNQIFKSKTRAYLAIQNAISRCHNENDPAYHRYGGRGISVCDEWRESPIRFVEYMPEQGRMDTLERIDNDKGYAPTNCKWATVDEQNNNKRSNIRITFENQTLTIAQWSKRINVRPDTLRIRINSGWSIEKALTTP